MRNCNSWLKTISGGNLRSFHGIKYIFDREISNRVHMQIQLFLTILS